MRKSPKLLELAVVGVGRRYTIVDESGQQIVEFVFHDRRLAIQVAATISRARGLAGNAVWAEAPNGDVRSEGTAADLLTRQAPPADTERASTFTPR